VAGTLARQAVLALAGNEMVQHLATSSTAGKRLVSRFIAGETLEDALTLTGHLNSRGYAVALDYLGENTRDIAESEAATAESLRAVTAIQQEDRQAYVSIKLTQFGLDLGEHVVLRNLGRLLEQARQPACFIRIDMEGSSYAARTLELFMQIHEQFAHVGVVIQAYLYRSAQDLARLCEAQARVRLVKGAYLEPPHIAFRRKRDTDRNFVRLMEYLLLHGNSPAIATHDPAILEHARGFADRHKIERGSYEFQMLLGVRRDLQEDLLQRGYQVRIYVPYGAEWYPYFTRRLAERPANALFLLRNLAAE
jgi:proline dehydrogenase